MMSRLLRLPPWLCGLIIVSAFIFFAVMGLACFRWLVEGRIQFTEQTNRDVIFFASAISVFYSLIVGLIAVGVWKNYTDAQSIVSDEATAIGCFYRDISGYEEPACGELQKEIHSYTDFLIDVAWPAQMRGEATEGATRRLTLLEQHLIGFEPTTPGQQILHAAAMHQYNQIAALRRKRIHIIGTGLPAVMWSVVLIGAALVIGITYLIQIEPSVQFILTGCFAMFIGLVVFVIASLDRPLSGPLAIDSRPYRIVRDRLMDLE